MLKNRLNIFLQQEDTDLNQHTHLIYEIIENLTKLRDSLGKHVVTKPEPQKPDITPSEYFERLKLLEERLIALENKLTARAHAHQSAIEHIVAKCKS